MNEDIIMILAGWKEMKEELGNIPHRTFMDLTLCYYVMQQAWRNSREVDLVLLSYEEADRRGLSDQDRLFAVALENTMRRFPLSIQDYGCGMYVLTNERGMFGATSMVYPEGLRNTSEKVGGDMVIIPLSIHEVVCLPADKADPDDVHELLMESIIERENDDNTKSVLSSNIYYYEAVRDRVSTLVSGGDMVQ